MPRPFFDRFRGSQARYAALGPAERETYPREVDPDEPEKLEPTDPGGTLDVDADFARLSALAGCDEQTTLIAVMDSGFDLAHPALEDNRWTNPTELPGDGEDNDENGLVDDGEGWDFANADSDVDSGKDARHGTHVAGIATRGTDRIDFIPLQVFGEGILGTEVADAIDYAALQGARVVNMSFKAHPEDLDAIYDAMERHPDVLFVIAAGNYGNDVTTEPCVDHFRMEWCNLVRPLPNSVLVAAADAKGAITDFSGYGSANVSVAAFGKDVRSCVPEGEYDEASGTSMAAPQVSALAAKCLALCPDLTPEQLRQLLVETSTPTEGWEGKVLAGGPIDPAKAMRLAALVGLIHRGATPEDAALKLGLQGEDGDALLSLAEAYPRELPT